MIFIKQYKYLLSGAICTILASTSLQKPVIADNISVLCSNRNMMTEMAVSTPEFHAAFCSMGYYEDSEYECYVPTEYYYVGQSRKTGESIVLTNATQSVEKDLLIWKARNENYTYQITQKGALEGEAWRTLSVFDNGRRVYHRKVNGYFGPLPCL